ncbi:MAG: DEAD/DEAH box helicase, partial [Proteobacteria bacterium]|nr:DEAD/DEAH box helicase [Pseudomonadota bacterium]
TTQQRKLLDSIHSLQDDERFIIDWEVREQGISLQTHPELLEILIKCPNICDEHLLPIKYYSVEGKLVLRIEEDNLLVSTLHLETPEGNYPFRGLLTNQYLIADRFIFKISKLGDYHKTLHTFQTQLLPGAINKFLSLFASRYGDIPIKYLDYETNFGNPETIKPSLLFERITRKGSLYLKVSATMSGFEPGFFEEYEISKVIHFNHEKKELRLSPVTLPTLSKCCRKVAHHLEQLQHEADATGEFYFFKREYLFLIEEPLITKFISIKLPALSTEFKILGAETLERYGLRNVEPQLTVKLQMGSHFLEGEANLEFDGESFALFEILNQFQQKNYVTLSDGSKTIVDGEVLKRLETLFQKGKQGVQISFFDLPEVEAAIGKKIDHASFDTYRKFYLGLNQLSQQKIELPQVQADLRDYQKTGFQWLRYLYQNNLGGCLADDMGLGKTLQAITLLASIYPDEPAPSLVVLPKSLLFNWENELKRFSPQLNYSIHYGQHRDLKRACNAQVVLTTYGLVRKEIKEFQKHRFHCVILDESQQIQNMNSQIAKAVMLLNCEKRFALSGTPIQNHLGELYSLFRFLNPSMFGSEADFLRRYSVPIQFSGNEQVTEELKKKIYPFVLRRIKKDVLLELPEKVEKIHYIEMSPEQQQLYDQKILFARHLLEEQLQGDDSTDQPFMMLQALSELRQIATLPELKSEGRIHSPKRVLLMEQLSDGIANGHKALVFSNYLGVLDHIGQDLKKQQIAYTKLTGATTKRKETVNKFQNDPNVKVFLMTLKAGGVGLNLTAADQIYIFDPWWNLAAESQAIDRCHRIGQDKTVFSYKLIAKDSIEEKIQHLQKLKGQLFESIITNDVNSSKFLSSQDLKFILGVDR